MTKVTLSCKFCSYKARRPLMIEPGNRGVSETSSEIAVCPNGHGILYRVDGVPQENFARWAEEMKEKYLSGDMLK